MNTPLDSKQKNWLWQITLLSVVLGMLLAASLKTQQTVKRASGIPTTRVSGLTQLILDEKERNKKLQDEIGSLRAKADKYEQAMGGGGNESQTRILKDELAKAKLFAGLSPAEGKGVEVVLRDSTKPIPTDSNPEIAASIAAEYIIHDMDLRQFVNELFASGADAVSISDKDSTQRIVAVTPIRCDAGVIKVNHVPMASPFTIAAIGPPNVMKTALEMQNGLVSLFRINDALTKTMVRIRTSDHLVIPAYSGITSFTYATTAKGGSPR
jgi:uncharacterized protein YlxW (UPF0749 family)